MHIYLRTNTHICIRGDRDVMVEVAGNGLANRLQILDDQICVLHSFS